MAADLRLGHKLSLDNYVPICYNASTMNDEEVLRCPCGAMHFSSYYANGVRHPVWRDDGTKQRVFIGDESFLLIKPGGYCPGCGALLNDDGTCGLHYKQLSDERDHYKRRAGHAILVTGCGICPQCKGSGVVMKYVDNNSNEVLGPTDCPKCNGIGIVVKAGRNRVEIEHDALEGNNE